MSFGLKNAPLIKMQQKCTKHLLANLPRKRLQTLEYKQSQREGTFIVPR